MLGWGINSPELCLGGKTFPMCYWYSYCGRMRERLILWPPQIYQFIGVELYYRSWWIMAICSYDIPPWYFGITGSGKSNVSFLKLHSIISWWFQYRFSNLFSSLSVIIMWGVVVLGWNLSVSPLSHMLQW